MKGKNDTIETILKVSGALKANEKFGVEMNESDPRWRKHYRQR